MSRNIYMQTDYDTKGRFASYWHQINEVLSFLSGDVMGGNVLIIGKGNGLVEWYLRQAGLSVTTLDIDETLNPDIVSSVLCMPIKDMSFDCCICCQVLEHLPFSDFIHAISEIERILKSYGRLIMSLPDLDRVYRFVFHFPVIGEFKFLLPVYTPRFLKKKWIFNGEHYWNIGNKGYHNKKIKGLIMQKFQLINEYRVFELSWHRFFILSKRVL